MTNSLGCFMCNDPMFTRKEGSFPQKIADLKVSTVILNRDWQFFKGSTLLVYREHITELHHLDPTMQHQFMDDASRVSAALEMAFPGVKLNHGLFGNTVPHLHWHIIVRRNTDPDPKSTIWESPFDVLDQSEQDLLATADHIRQYL